MDFMFNSTIYDMVIMYFRIGGLYEGKRIAIILVFKRSSF